MQPAHERSPITKNKPENTSRGGPARGKVAAAAATTGGGNAPEHDEQMNGGGGERVTGNISGAGDWRGMGAHACSCSARARPCWVRSSGVRGAPPAGNMSSVAMAYDEYFVQQAGGGGDAHLQRCCHHTMAIWGGAWTQRSLRCRFWA